MFARAARGIGLSTCALLLAGCGMVGWKYNYGGHEYTMTKSNSDYHEHAVKDVRTRFGDPSSQDDVAKLKGACELLQKYAADAPDPGQFTPARELLDNEAHTACERAHSAKEQADRKAEADRRDAENERRRHDAEQQRDAQDRQRIADRQNQENQRLAMTLERDTRTVENCDATESARAARRRHATIVDQAPGAAVRKQCVPHKGTVTMKAECKDANGFVRPCTKTVASGDIAGYRCPKTMDPEVVQLGLFQLDLLESYPYPEDRSIRLRDSECDEARARFKQNREKVGTTPAAVGSQP